MVELVEQHANYWLMMFQIQLSTFKVSLGKTMEAACMLAAIWICVVMGEWEATVKHFWGLWRCNQSINIYVFVQCLITPKGISKGFANQKKKEPTGPPSKQGASMASKNYPVGRKLKQVQTPEGRHVPINSWSENVVREWDRVTNKEKEREKLDEDRLDS